MPVLLPAHAGAQETLRQGAGPAMAQIDRQKGPKGPFCGQIWSTFGKKVPCRAWGRVWDSGGSKKSPMSHVGECGVSEKKKRLKSKGSPTRGEGGPHAWGRGEGSPTKKILRIQRAKSAFFFTHFDQNPLTLEVPPNTPPRGIPPPPPLRVVDPPPLCVVDPLPYA